MPRALSKSPFEDIAILGFGFVGKAWGQQLASLFPRVRLRVFDPDFSGELPLRFIRTSSVSKAVSRSDLIIIAVPTHLGGEGVSGRGWRRLATEIRRHAKLSAIVMVKSTLSPVDVCELKGLIGRPVVVCPEFMAEGTAAEDLRRPTRVIIGGDHEDAMGAINRLFLAWVPRRKIFKTDVHTAALIKLFANAMLAQRVSSANALAVICEQGGGDAAFVARLAGIDPRIGRRFLTPSPGFGGSCLQKDLDIFSDYARMLSAGDAADYWSAVSRMNTQRIARTAARISKLARPGGGIAVLGLTFKAGVADFRHSSALAVARRLADLGHKVSSYDPCGEPCHALGMVRPRSSVMTAVKGAKVIAILTEWPAFRRINWYSVAKICPNAVVYDGRQIADLRAIRKAGLACVRLGAC